MHRLELNAHVREKKFEEVLFSKPHFLESDLEKQYSC